MAQEQVSTYIRELWGEIILCEEVKGAIDTSEGSPVSKRVFNMRDLALCLGFTRSEHRAFLME